MTALEQFIVHNVEGYLFGDLRRLQTIEVGYPLLMTTFAGVELLGALTSASSFGVNKGFAYFLSYWENYLYPQGKNSRQIGEVLYQLVRHGIAHGFVLKGPIGVLRSDSASHLTIDPSGLILVDAVQLSNDFMKSFSDNVKPLLSTTSGAVNALSLGSRLSEMTALYEMQAKKWPTAPVFPIGTVAASTAISQSVAPTPDTPDGTPSGSVA